MKKKFTREEMLKCADDFERLSRKCRAATQGGTAEELFGDMADLFGGSLKDIFKGKDGKGEKE